MISCPYCNAENIPGVDECAECGQPLSDMHLRDPSTGVEQSLVKDRISVLTPKQPITVAAETPVLEVLRLMVDRGIGCLIVAADDKPVGIFSERDALMKLNTEAARLGDHPVSEFMTPDPQTLEADAKIAFAVQRMDVGGYRHIPIVGEKGQLTGIISVRDILRYLTKEMTAAGTA